jgi:hypothetical protein
MYGIDFEKYGARDDAQWCIFQVEVLSETPQGYLCDLIEKL